MGVAIRSIEKPASHGWINNEINKEYFMLKISYLLAISFSTFTLFTTPEGDKNSSQWHQWRGPAATGVATTGSPPVEWSETKNVKWKTAIPGLGLSTPIIWEDTIFLTTAIGASAKGKGRFKTLKAGTPQNFVVIAVNKNSGKILWQKTAVEQKPHEGAHGDASWASNSAITDGKLVFAHFGSNGLFCYDFAGNLKWKKDLGNMRTRNGFGEGSSPALHGNTLVLNWDHEGESFITALDKTSGKQLWKVKRDEATSWSTPLIVEQNGAAQVIINATGMTRGYDLKTGTQIWQAKGMTVNTIPSPVYGDGVVYVMSGYRGNDLQAIDLAKAKGDISDSDAVIWKYSRDTPYVPSPLLYGNELYMLKSNRAILACLDAKTGKLNYGTQRLPGIRNVYASLVGAGNHVYILGRKGGAVVLKRGAQFEVVAENKLDDGFDASPAVVGNELFLRGRKNIYCISKTE